jgi:co-chaperonin GroES (HSP10)
MNLRPLVNLVIIEKVSQGLESTLPSGIIIKHNVPGQLQIGKIIGASGYIRINDKLIPSELKEGDMVLYDVHRVINVVMENPNHFIVNENDIAGITEEDDDNG